jgi:hypothetical protein
MARKSASGVMLSAKVSNVPPGAIDLSPFFIVHDLFQ